MGMDFTGFFTGAANQLTDSINAGKKRKEERDKRREEEADKLSMFLKQSAYNKQADEEKFTRETAVNKANEIEKEGRSVGLYQQTKGIEFGYQKQLEAFKGGQEIARDKAKAATEAEASKEMREFLSGQFGAINGSLKPTTQAAPITDGKQSFAPPVDAAPVVAAPTHAALSRKKAAIETLQGDKHMGPYAKGYADSIGTQMAQLKEEGKYNGKGREYSGGDPFKSQGDRLKTANPRDDARAASPYFKKRPNDLLKVRYSNPKHTTAVAEQQMLMQSLGDHTRIMDESLGVESNVSKLAPAVVEEASFAITSAKYVLLDPLANEAEKKGAIKTIDTALKFTGVTNEKLLQDPNLKAVFDGEFRKVYNHFAPSVESLGATGAKAAPEAGGSVGVTAEEFARLPSGAKYTAPDGTTRKKP